MMRLLDIDAEIVNLENHIAKLRSMRAALAPRFKIPADIREAQNIDQALAMIAAENPDTCVHWSEIASVLHWYQPRSVYNRLMESVRIVRQDPSCDCSLSAAGWCKPSGENDGMFYSRY